jgi:hypothetical protein
MELISLMRHDTIEGGANESSEWMITFDDGGWRQY